MRENFEFWMKTKEGKKQNTAYSYANSIEKLSHHYSQHTRQTVDIYREKNLNLIEKIAQDYAIGGRFSKYGNEGNGTIRNAIATYVRFLRNSTFGKELSEVPVEQDENHTEVEVNDDEITSNNYNFTYERDLKNSLINQASHLFPGYVIYGNSREGIEFSIEGKRRMGVKSTFDPYC